MVDRRYSTFLNMIMGKYWYLFFALEMIKKYTVSLTGELIVEVEM
jgi:hypothetical protein